MPALPDYPNVLRVDTDFTVGTDLDVRSRLHYIYSGSAPTDATCVTLATDIYALGVSHLVPLLANENNLSGVAVTDLTTPSSGVGAYLSVTPGTRGAGDPLAAEVAALHNLAISRRYRGGKPRVYWPIGIGSDLTSPSAWDGSSITAFELGLNDYIIGTEALSVSGTSLGALCSISYYQGFTAVTNPITGRTRDVPKVRSVAIAPDVIITLAVNPKPGSQRRRQQHST